MISSANSEHFILFRTRYETRQIVCDNLRADCRFKPLDDEVGGLVPAEVAEHHFARKDYRAGVHLVEVCVLGRGAVGGLENRVSRGVVDVAAGSDADAADLRGERVGDVVAVEVERRHDVVFGGTRENLLQEGVGNAVFNDNAVGQFAPRAARRWAARRILRGRLCSPVAERAFGELHDVALVDEGNALAVLGYRVVDCRADKTRRALFRNGLDAYAARFGEADFRVSGGKILLDESSIFLASGVPRSNSMPA